MASSGVTTSGIASSAKPVKLSKTEYIRQKMIYYEKEREFIETNPESAKAVLKNKFGSYDYERLAEEGEADDITRLSSVSKDNVSLAAAIAELIRSNKLYIMDKESGVAMPASLVIGYNRDSLLITCER